MIGVSFGVFGLYYVGLIAGEPLAQRRQGHAHSGPCGRPTSFSSSSESHCSRASAGPAVPRAAETWASSRTPSRPGSPGSGIGLPASVVPPERRRERHRSRAISLVPPDRARRPGGRRRRARAAHSTSDPQARIQDRPARLATYSSSGSRSSSTTALGFPVLVIVIDLTDHLQTYLQRNIPAPRIALELHLLDSGLDVSGAAGRRAVRDGVLDRGASLATRRSQPPRRPASASTD